MDFLKLTTGFADDMLTLGGWVLKKMEAHGTLHNPQDVLGLQAEVSVGIKPGGTGEIIVIQAKKLHHYPAQSKEPNVEFARGAMVRVAEVGAGVMSVVKYEATGATNVTVQPENTDITNGASADKSKAVEAEAVDAETIDADTV